MKAIALALVLVVGGSAAIAAELRTDKVSVADDKPINKKCPVSGKDADEKCTSKYKEHVVAFCCGNCKGKFDADPAKCIKNVKHEAAK
jgi:hypothetical protein